MFDNGGFPLGVDGRIHLKKKRGKIVVYQKDNLYVKKTKLKWKLTVKTFWTTRAITGMKGSNNIWQSWSRLPLRVAGLTWKLGNAIKFKQIKKRLIRAGSHIPSGWHLRQRRVVHWAGVIRASAAIFGTAEIQVVHDFRSHSTSGSSRKTN